MFDDNGDDLAGHSSNSKQARRLYSTQGWLNLRLHPWKLVAVGGCLGDWIISQSFKVEEEMERQK